ncbi:unnamed protein product [Rotaria sordida]|uniref:PDZ domain-containing protein n=1 Tax=Rotaria sordida TaxID=392033 RepID=A0A815PYD1_9BILA|nr:unnamed protein product [Rotaria sordida]CAF1456089.1 unnamed protein product [Rotaria sordida]CAF1640521.1 unnamed protein product [Rotaria sordida]CAF1640533.1 unnamed protein product [Rotaria sordida]
MTPGESPNLTKIQENQQQTETSQSDMDIIPSSIQGEEIHVVHLCRTTDYDGYGFRLQYNKSYFLVHEIENDSPAAKSGLHVNDIILSLNQQLTENMSHATFVELLTDNSNLDCIVQPFEKFLHSNHPATLNRQAISIISTDHNNDDKKTLKMRFFNAWRKLIRR